MSGSSASDLICRSSGAETVYGRFATNISLLWSEDVDVALWLHTFRSPEATEDDLGFGYKHFAPGERDGLISNYQICDSPLGERVSEACTRKNEPRDRLGVFDASVADHFEQSRKRMAFDRQQFIFLQLLTDFG